MKKTVFITFLFFAFYLGAHGQGCLPDGITFVSQAEIDSFPFRYPDCTGIDGTINISGSDIVNLEPLSSLTSAGQILITSTRLRNLNGLNHLTEAKRLNISSNDSLLTLQGLEQLNIIHENLEITHNEKLINLNGLDNLTRVDVSFYIGNNGILSDLNGLEKLTTVGDITIQNCSALQDLTGLQHLVSVKGIGILSNATLKNLSGFDHISEGEIQQCTINDNASLLDISALQNITKISGGLQINANQALLSLNGLQNIKEVGDLAIYSNGSLLNLNGLDSISKVASVSIAGNPILNNMNGMQGVSAIAGILYISGNPMLVSLGGLEHLKMVGASISIGSNIMLADLNGLSGLKTVHGNIEISSNFALADLNGLGQLDTVDGIITIQNNKGLLSLDGISNLEKIRGFEIFQNQVLENIDAIENVDTSNIYSMLISGNPKLKNLNGLHNFKKIEILKIEDNDALIGLEGLEHVTSVFSLYVCYNDSLKSLAALSSLDSARNNFRIALNNSLQHLSGLEKLSFVGPDFAVYENPVLENLEGLEGLKTIDGSILIRENDALKNLNGLQNLTKINDDILIRDNDALLNIDALSNVSSSINSLQILNNKTLSSINGLKNVTQINSYLLINQNIALSGCSIYAVCSRLLNGGNAQFYIAYNAQGCNSDEEIKAACQTVPVIAEVRIDENGNCTFDTSDSPAPDIMVELNATTAQHFKTTDTLGVSFFKFFGSDTFLLDLPQFPTVNWSVCTAPLIFTPNGATDTIRAAFLLSPIKLCPEIEVNLGLPTSFRGCLVTSNLQVEVKNSGTSKATGVKLAVILPTVLDLVSSIPLFDAQMDDTLYFDMGDLSPFERKHALLTVKTKCDTFLLGQSLCIDAYAILENVCPDTITAFSEIKLSAQCIGDTLVRFVMKNIGNAPTQGYHAYKIIRNDIIISDFTFSLGKQDSLVFDFPADSATWRMEATKFDNGILTATAIENCGGLTPGWINAFWLDRGSLRNDFACRPVVIAFDPNLKSAVPSGAGTDHIISANQPIQYTIDFQNTGTDTAFRVFLRDPLPEALDLKTFQPGFASHPYSWEIRNDTLEVLFLPISLPDSNVNEPASHGFFSFNIHQKPDLPLGAYLENTASIVFDYNPPIYTNTVTHRIGQLLVKVDEPRVHETAWHVIGNPTRNIVVFRSTTEIPGRKLFELFDVSGRLVSRAEFSGQSFEFQSNMLTNGLYFFSISDAQGRAFAGKIILTD